MLYATAGGLCACSLVHVDWQKWSLMCRCCDLELISSNRLVAAEGPHAFDFESNKPEDPPSLAQARQQGQQSISSWVDQWNAKKTQIPLSSPAEILHSNPAFGGYTTYLNSTASDGLVVTNLTAITA